MADLQTILDARGGGGGAGTLDEAYTGGNTITTTALAGDVDIAGTEAAVISADGGLDISGGTTQTSSIAVGGGAPTLGPNELFRATFGAGFDADAAAGVVTATTNGTPTITSDKLNTNGQSGGICWDAVGNWTPEVGTLRFKLTPNVTGGPAATTELFEISGPARQNRLQLRWFGSGLLNIQYGTASGGSSAGASFPGTWLPTTGVEYEMEINYDFIGSLIELYIDGVFYGSVVPPAIGRDAVETNPLVKIGFGCSTYAGTEVRFDGVYDDIQLFSTIQHTGGAGGNFAGDIPRVVAGATVGASLANIQMHGSTAGTLGLIAAPTTISHDLTLPSSQGAASTVLTNDGSGGLSWGAGGGGGLAYTVLSEPAGTTLAVATSYLVVADAGDVSVTLPLISTTTAGDTIEIVINGKTNERACTVSAGGADALTGYESEKGNAKYAVGTANIMGGTSGAHKMIVISDGTDWFFVASRLPSPNFS